MEGCHISQFSCLCTTIPLTPYPSTSLSYHPPITYYDKITLFFFKPFHIQCSGLGNKFSGQRTDMFLIVSVPGLKMLVPKGTDWWKIISVLLKNYQSDWKLKPILIPDFDLQKLKTTVLYRPLLAIRNKVLGLIYAVTPTPLCLKQIYISLSDQQ